MRSRSVFGNSFFWLLMAGVILIALPPFLSSYWVGLITQMLIAGILAVSLDILLGYTGLPSFGHAGFFGCAAYTVAILSTKYMVGFGLSILGAIILVLFVGAIFGLLVSHTTSSYYLMITFALGMCLWGLSMRWTTFTGGDMGIAGIMRPDIGLSLDMNDTTTFYYFTLLIFALTFLCMFIFVRSPFGQTLKGIRESESRMRMLGYNTWLHKYLAFVASSLFAGISGILWVNYTGYVGPQDLDFMTSMRPFLMCIVGGFGTLVGPAFGAVLVIFLENFVSGITQRWQIVLGAVFIIIIMFAPMGLINLVKHAFMTRTSGAKPSRSQEALLGD